jgi:hypothetical protein
VVSATSGLNVRIWRDEDGRYSHRLRDPATGEPAWTGLIGATALGDTRSKRIRRVIGSRRVERLNAWFSPMLLAMPISSIARRPICADQIGRLEAPNSGKSYVAALGRRVDLRKAGPGQLVPGCLYEEAATACAALFSLAVDSLQ